LGLVLFPWEVKYLSSYFIQSLFTRFKDSSEGFSTDLLLSLLMLMTARAEALLPSDGRVIDLVLNLAWKGSNTAKALVPNVLEFYGREAPPEVRHHILPWLKDAVESGSILARSDLERLDPAALVKSIQAFQDHGGYSNIYLKDPNCTALHEIVISGSTTQVRDFCSSHENYNIEERTACDETPLYLACARGEMDIATELISRGASASVTCTEFGISCLHWVFTYTEPFLNRAIVRLREAGADIDAMTVEPVPFPHYPFILPAGSALHWAIATGNHAAARALIEQGASLNIRNGSDPYRYDRRVRVLEGVGIDQDPYSEPERPTQGLSPLDYAAMQHDPFVFETLHSSGTHVDINAVDEEGFTVLHRLSSGHIYHTREGSSFSLLPFRGSPDTLDQNLRRTISAIRSLGGNLEMLTTPWTSYPNWPVESRTALMLAVESGLPNVVRALVDAGACPNTKNEAGKTALFYLSEEKNIDFESAKILVSAGADVNHRAGHGKGNSALCMAAHRTNLDLVDLFLSCGANIEERYLNSGVRQKRLCSIFGLLAKKLPDVDDDDAANDQQVASILEKYLFTAPDADQRHRIMEHDVGGRTLLYRFSEVAFPHTVNSLLRHGAQVGAQAECCLERDPEALPLKSHETPLYVARNFKRNGDHIRNIGQKTKTVPDYNTQFEKMDMVVKSLVDAGWT
jgi:ankyrin repeat protein